jgi:AcrR family transcriptional regulator
MNEQMTKQRESRSDATRQALIMAGLDLFGSQGFEGASTRRIAAMANANIGSIAYHFGNKDGLREACAEFVVNTIRSIAGPAVGLAEGPAAGPEEAEERLVRTVQTVVNVLVSGRVAPQVIQFILREVTHAGPALDIIYRGVFEPVHMRLCQLWEQATGEPAEAEETRIVVFTMIGQVVYLRIGREAVVRRMGWSEVGPEEAAKMAVVAARNIRTIIRSRKGAQS